VRNTARTPDRSRPSRSALVTIASGDLPMLGRFLDREQRRATGLAGRRSWSVRRKGMVARAVGADELLDEAVEHYPGGDLLGRTPPGAGSGSWRPTPNSCQRPHPVPGVAA
jgi:hypothetical protein